ncbi:inter-alpha-trypsin inhibitor heavy chain H3-like [Betta splendens]|uniref:Inter-alpha-trypsin inhibitor heavy chain H3-like n=1 Tax=Betta splendens TaxID=158456 RepID=A0A9W2XT82_BETSP|nr:inter-alpha-trypsin inhibitor heavy chain H3-like [Betta splendens]
MTDVKEKNESQKIAEWMTNLLKEKEIVNANKLPDGALSQKGGKDCARRPDPHQGHQTKDVVEAAADWDIYSFHINSTVTSRYATTVITSRVANRMNESKEVEFQSNVQKAIAGKFPLYCLGFRVNFEFLEKMSLQNNGVARRIYEDSDADLQLEGFYEEVATPLLTNVTMMYTGGINLTQTHFTQYYNGSEIVVAGQITDNDIETFTPEVIAISGTGSVRFSDTNPTVESADTVSDLQRVFWAYLTVKQLLDKA